ncbi:MAG TPA: alpha/beta fold hydrolase [Propionibacteriaceae bacterium]|nr:alpha/beta fold hydrolase [Propionibacteriaceae bacterium]
MTQPPYPSHPQGEPSPDAPGPAEQPSPYVAPTFHGSTGPYGPPQPGPSHLGPNGALQSYGVVPGSQQRPAGPYGRQQLYGQPSAGQQPTYGANGPSWAPPVPATRPPSGPPKRSQAGVVVGVAALLVLSLVIVVAFAGGYVQRLFAQPVASSPAPTPTATAAPSASPTATSTSGVVISKPPVPAPTATTDRTYTSPDRPKATIPNVKPAGFINAPAGSGLARYTKQALNWADCTVNKQAVKCATVAAPLDYAAPDGQALTLKLVKVSATASPRLGTIFVNPGGPGEPGTTLAVSFQRTGLEQYDVVGWDPRGTGGSTPVVCENGAAVDQLMQLDQSPDNATEKQALLDGWKAFGASCLAKSGPLLTHIATVDTVQDLDMLRQLVGDAKLNYLGYSYGTYIGAVYAQKFPTTVGKLVLDSAVNITKDESVIQASGFDLALGNYAQYCASKGCSLGSTKQQVLDTVSRLLDKLDSSPLPGDSTRKLTQSVASDGIAIFLYADSQYWDQLTQALEKALTGDGRYLLYYSDQLRGRGTDGQYDTSFFAFPAIGCADSQDDGIARAFSDWTSDQQKAPIFGKYFGPNVTCVQWPVQGTPPFDITAKGAAPIVVVGATGDSATPYQYAAWMASQLASGVLVTYNGNGHATYGGKSACVDKAVVAYFAKGTVPPDGLYCTA